MRKILLGRLVAAMAIGCCSFAAQAQDDWSGVYGGVNAFASRDNVKTRGTLLVNQISNLFVTGRGLVVVPGTTRDFSASSRKTNIEWGGQLGYLYQTGNFVLGVEGDFDPSHHNVTARDSQLLPPTALTPSATISIARNVRIGSEWSLRARAGYAFGNTLAYATGGYVSARASVVGVDSFTNPGGPAAACSPNCTANLGPEGPNRTTNGNARKTLGGWRVGAGVEQRIGKHFSIGLEYLHTDFGARNIAFHSSVTEFTGPFTHGTDNGTGIHGQVNSAGTRARMTSDAIGLRLNFHL